MLTHTFKLVLELVLTSIFLGVEFKSFIEDHFLLIAKDQQNVVQSLALLKVCVIVWLISPPLFHYNV